MNCSSPVARTSEVTDHFIVVLKITLVVFIVSSLLDMGLRLDPRDAARGLRNVRFVGLTLFWGFVASPALEHFQAFWNHRVFRNGVDM